MSSIVKDVNCNSSTSLADLKMPVISTSTTAPLKGKIAYDTTTNQPQFGNDSAWSSFSPSAKNVWQNARDACVTLHTVDGQSSAACSGSFIQVTNGIGYILTAAHCVGNTTPGGLVLNDAIYAHINNYNGTGVARIRTCNVVGYDGVGDIAILSVSGMTVNQKVLEWGDSLSKLPGDRCYLIGNPLGIDHQSISEGAIRDPMYVDKDGTQLLETMWISAGGFAGNSGSCILDENSKIIGLYTYGPGTQETLGGGASQRLCQTVANKIITTGQNYREFRGELGIIAAPVDAQIAVDLGLADTNFNVRGMSVTNVKAGRPAALAGIVNGDIITEVQGLTCGLNFGQTSHSTGYWHLARGSVINVKVLTAASNYTVEALLNITLNFAPLVSEDTPLSGNS